MAAPRLNEDTLFLACTRPAMVGGVTMEAMGINIIVTSVLFILGGNLLFSLVGVVFHLGFKALCKYDHNMFRVLIAYLETRGRSLNSSYWGGSSITPLKVVRRYNERDWNLA